MQTDSHIQWLVILILSCLCGCSGRVTKPAVSGSEPGSGIATVYTVNYPLLYFAQRIGGQHTLVVFPAPPDVDPAFWTPDAQTIAAYQRADLVLLNGASFAKWIDIVSLRTSQIVDTSAAFADQYIKVEDAVTHTHGPGGEHEHTDTAFMTWLDPKLAVAQAESIRQALSKLRPQYSQEFQRNFAQLENDLNALDLGLSAVFEGKSDRAVLFSHPVYQYLQRRYELNARAVHWEPHEVPTQKMWDDLAVTLQQHPARWMVWEGAPIEENVKRLGAMGLRCTVFSPCVNVSEDGDFLTIMQQNVKNMAEVFAD